MPDRTVIIVQRDRRRVTFATQVLKSPRGYRYPLFGSTDRNEARRMTEKQALRLLNEWRGMDRPGANKCGIEPAS